MSFKTAGIQRLFGRDSYNQDVRAFSFQRGKNLDWGGGGVIFICGGVIGARRS